MNTLQLSTEIVTRLNAAIENGESKLNQQAIVQGCIEREWKSAETREIMEEMAKRMGNYPFPGEPIRYQRHW